MKKLILLTFLCINIYASQTTHKIVNLAPSINEIVYALGMGDSVVANTQYCNYPKESQEVLKIGGYASISLEKILSVKPTVVIGQNYDNKLHNNLKNLGIKTKIYETKTLDDIKNTITELGDYFDKKENASKLVNEINKGLDKLKNITTNKRILIVISPKKDLYRQIYVTGNNLYFEDMIIASGNKNAFFSLSNSQPTVNVEKIIKLNPDIIVLLAPFFEGKKQELEVVKNSWKKLPINASKNDYIYAVDKVYAGVPSQRVIYFMEDFRKILEDVRNKELQ